MRWRKTYIDGTFGDKTVLLTTGVIDAPKGCVLLFHGVHSNATSEPGNKYARIGTDIAQSGFIPVLVETSRLIRDRRPYADAPMRWVTDAFTGKTCDQELEDFYRAFQAMRVIYSHLPLMLWGFSLGGLCALLIAGGAKTSGKAPEGIDGLIICGSGDSVGPENQDIFKLPILDSLREVGDLTAAAHGLRVRWTRAFRGTQDATFPRDACVRLYDAMSVADKAYYDIEGSDHSFRFLNGAPSRKPLDDVEALIPQIFGER